MRPICIWRQREIARKLIRGEPMPPDSALGKHLESCSECAQARRDFSLLQDTLPASSPIPSLSAGFDERLQARLLAEAQTRGKSPAQTVRPDAVAHLQRASVALAALTAVGLWIAALQLYRPHSTEIVNSGRKRPVTAKEFASAGRKPRTWPPDTPVSLLFANMPDLPFQSTRHKKHHAHEVMVAGWVRREEYWRHGHRQRLPRFSPSLAFAVKIRLGANAAARALQPEAGLTDTTLNVSATWREAGDTYEAYGDYSRAAQAYGNAFEGQPDAELAISASVNAERAGDTSSALDYFAQALR